MNLNFGENIRNIRLLRNIKQQELAEEIGYKTASSINDIEKGRRNIPAKRIPILSKILKVTVDELFFEENYRETRITKVDKKNKSNYEK